MLVQNDRFWQYLVVLNHQVLRHVLLFRGNVIITRKERKLQMFENKIQLFVTQSEKVRLEVIV
jgi:hypothetical protein